MSDRSRIFWAALDACTVAGPWQNLASNLRKYLALGNEKRAAEMVKHLAKAIPPSAYTPLGAPAFMWAFAGNTYDARLAVARELHDGAWPTDPPNEEETVAAWIEFWGAINTPGPIEYVRKRIGAAKLQADLLAAIIKFAPMSLPVDSAVVIRRAVDADWSKARDFANLALAAR